MKRISSRWSDKIELTNLGRRTAQEIDAEKKLRAKEASPIDYARAILRTRIAALKDNCIN